MQCYNTKGTCSRQIFFDVTEDNKVTGVKFINGCRGNLQAVSKLVEGKDVDEVKDDVESNEEAIEEAKEKTEEHKDDLAEWKATIESEIAQIKQTLAGFAKEPKETDKSEAQRLDELAKKFE